VQQQRLRRRSSHRSCRCLIRCSDAGTRFASMRGPFLQLNLAFALFMQECAPHVCGMQLKRDSRNGDYDSGRGHRDRRCL
jgi:hypothetical protein